MEASSGLESRIRVLEDIEALRKLKARYFRVIDRQQWDDLAGCFSADAVWESVKRNVRVEGAEAIARFIRSVEEGVQIVNAHQGHNAEIEITGEATAKGTWELFHYREDKTAGQVQESAAFYEDRYAREAGIWKIVHCRIIPIYLNVSALS